MANSSLRELQLYFDGSCQANPGEAGGGAVCTDASNGSVLWRVCQYLGNQGTSNQAEYTGLVCGLRQLLRQPENISLEVIGDSELVLKQLQGEYAVNDPIIKFYHAIAANLLTRLSSVRYQHVPRQSNVEAHDAAEKGLRMRRQQQSTVFYPNLCGVSPVAVEGSEGVGSEVTVTNDIMAASSGCEFMVDAAFLASLPSFGISAISELADPCPLSIVVGKVAMAVLGILRRSLVLWIKLNPDSIPVRIIVNDAI
eukprot:1172465-Prorocentrum_minimum.AAC.1